MSILKARQNVPFDGNNISNGNDLYNDDDVSFWWTREGQIVRWSVFLGLFGAFILFMILGRVHANRRIKKGLPPLRYHRWLLSRQQRALYDPSYRDPQVFYNPYHTAGNYGMHPMPPPVYDPNAAMPPSYQPPEGATKVDPTQWRAEPTRRPAAGDPSPSYTAPAGPPPNVA